MHNLFFSQYHLCSIGYEDGEDGTKMGGILKGDSGSALQVHEYGRLSTFIIFIKTTLKASCMYRYSAIGVSSFGNTKNTLENRVPDVYAKVTPDIKKWIQGIATNTQDSNCGIEA